MIKDFDRAEQIAGAVNDYHAAQFEERQAREQCNVMRQIHFIDCMGKRIPTTMTLLTQQAIEKAYIADMAARVAKAKARVTTCVAELA